ncbi:hypothetical protein FVE85_8772 [Porphyridium purpureum]|uniref:Uncharacterized protein n=1 Tax=Porphyridium purpureum TaxID=35688 RepID=A0A5J4YSB5_PORPP|nr:hypothetical protein FVE85_8772 [Porphyridium purpureum]|eukprot:POR2079..scf296_7
MARHSSASGSGTSASDGQRDARALTRWGSTLQWLLTGLAVLGATSMLHVVLSGVVAHSRMLAHVSRAVSSGNVVNERDALLFSASLGGLSSSVSHHLRKTLSVFSVDGEFLQDADQEQQPTMSSDAYRRKRMVDSVSSSLGHAWIGRAADAYTATGAIQVFYDTSGSFGTSAKDKKASAVSSIAAHDVLFCRVYGACRMADGSLLLPEWMKLHHEQLQFCGIGELAVYNIQIPRRGSRVQRAIVPLRSSLRPYSTSDLVVGSSAISSTDADAYIAHVFKLVAASRVVSTPDTVRRKKYSVGASCVHEFAQSCPTRMFLSLIRRTSSRWRYWIGRIPVLRNYFPDFSARLAYETAVPVTPVLIQENGNSLRDCAFDSWGPRTDAAMQQRPSNHSITVVDLDEQVAPADQPSRSHAKWNKKVCEVVTHRMRPRAYTAMSSADFVRTTGEDVAVCFRSVLSVVSPSASHSTSTAKGTRDRATQMQPVAQVQGDRILTPDHPLYTTTGLVRNNRLQASRLSASGGAGACSLNLVLFTEKLGDDTLADLRQQAERLFKGLVQASDSSSSSSQTQQVDRAIMRADTYKGLNMRELVKYLFLAQYGSKLRIELTFAGRDSDAEQKIRAVQDADILVAFGVNKLDVAYDADAAVFLRRDAAFVHLIPFGVPDWRHYDELARVAGFQYTSVMARLDVNAFYNCIERANVRTPAVQTFLVQLKNYLTEHFSERGDPNTGPRGPDSAGGTSALEQQLYAKDLALQRLVLDEVTATAPGEIRDIEKCARSYDVRIMHSVLASAIIDHAARQCFLARTDFVL